MTRSIGALTAASTALLLAVSVSPALAGVHFQKETLSAYQAQLNHGEVHADAFHPGTPSGHLHVSLNDGGHFTVAYTAAEQAQLAEQARAKGARVLVAKAKPQAKAVVHHKLRYIAGGILIVVILIVLAVLLIGRRRTLAQQQGGEASGEGTVT